MDLLRYCIRPWINAPKCSKNFTEVDSVDAINATGSGRIILQIASTEAYPVSVSLDYPSIEIYGIGNAIVYFTPKVTNERIILNNCTIITENKETLSHHGYLFLHNVKFIKKIAIDSNQLFMSDTSLENIEFLSSDGFLHLEINDDLIPTQITHIKAERYSIKCRNKAVKLKFAPSFIEVLIEDKLVLNIYLIESYEADIEFINSSVEIPQILEKMSTFYFPKIKFTNSRVIVNEIRTSTDSDTDLFSFEKCDIKFYGRNIDCLITIDNSTITTSQDMYFRRIFFIGENSLKSDASRKVYFESVSFNGFQFNFLNYEFKFITRYAYASVSTFTNLGSWTIDGLEINDVTLNFDSLLIRNYLKIYNTLKTHDCKIYCKQFEAPDDFEIKITITNIDIANKSLMHKNFAIVNVTEDMKINQRTIQITGILENEKTSSYTKKFTLVFNKTQIAYRIDSNLSTVHPKICVGKWINQCQGYSDDTNLWKKYVSNVTNIVTVYLNGKSNDYLIDVSGIDYTGFTLQIEPYLKSPNIDLVAHGTKVPNGIVLRNYSILRSADIEYLPHLKLIDTIVNSNVNVANIEIIETNNYLNLGQFIYSNKSKFKLNQLGGIAMMTFENDKLTISDMTLTPVVIDTKKMQLTIASNGIMSILTTFKTKNTGSVVYLEAQTINLLLYKNMSQSIENPLFKIRNTANMYVVVNSDDASMFELESHSSVYITHDSNMKSVKIHNSLPVNASSIRSVVENIICRNPVFETDTAMKFTSFFLAKLQLYDAVFESKNVTLSDVEFHNSVTFKESNTVLNDVNFEDSTVYIEGRYINIFLENIQLSNKPPKSIIINDKNSLITVDFSDSSYMLNEWRMRVKSGLKYYVPVVTAENSAILITMTNKQSKVLMYALIGLSVFVVVVGTTITALIIIYVKKHKIERKKVMNNELFNTLHLEDDSSIVVDD